MDRARRVRRRRAADRHLAEAADRPAGALHRPMGGAARRKQALGRCCDDPWRIDPRRDEPASAGAGGYRAAGTRAAGCAKIGRAWGRERGCQYVLISVVVVSCKKKCEYKIHISIS